MRTKALVPKFGGEATTRPCFVSLILSFASYSLASWCPSERSELGTLNCFDYGDVKTCGLGLGTTGNSLWPSCLPSQAKDDPLCFSL